MNLIINLPDSEVQALRAKAASRGLSAEQYALRVLEQYLAPEWLRQSWASAQKNELDQFSIEEIDAEILAARNARRESQSGV